MLLLIVIESASMKISEQYRINTPQTIFEVFDDEIIIVSFFDGSYYSVKGSAAIIWKSIAAGAPAQRIIDSLVAMHPADANRVIQGVTSFISELARLNLIVPVEAIADHADAVEIEKSALPTEFQAPVLESYDDMQDLLLLDPIHDVDEMGWPQKTPDATTRPA
jgi:hypothetical protein